jgi:hypothetical protein
MSKREEPQTETITSKVKAMAKEQQEQEEVVLTTLSPSETKLLSGLVTKVAAKFGLPAILVAALSAGVGSYFGKGDAATKSDLESMQKDIEKKIEGGESRASAIEVRLNQAEKDNIKVTLILDGIVRDFSEYKRTHP